LKNLNWQGFFDGGLSETVREGRKGVGTDPEWQVSTRGWGTKEGGQNTIQHKARPEFFVFFAPIQPEKRGVRWVEALKFELNLTEKNRARRKKKDKVGRRRSGGCRKKEEGAGAGERKTTANIQVRGGFHSGLETSKREKSTGTKQKGYRVFFRGGWGEKKKRDLQRLLLGLQFKRRRWT